MKPTDEVLQIAPAIIRTYAISFLLLPLNLFSTYYFRALLKAKMYFLVSVVLGVLLPCALIMLIPIWFETNAIWFAMPITEFITTIVVVFITIHYAKALDRFS